MTLREAAQSCETVGHHDTHNTCDISRERYRQTAGFAIIELVAS